MKPDPRYVASRRVLLDALEALQEQLDAIVVAGAQAVYLRTGDANIGVAEYTTDGDLAVDADRLGPAPLLADVMGERFNHAKGSSGAEEPGVWVQTIEIEGGSVSVPIDLIVPEGLAPPGGSRGARLGPHGNRAARKAVGLEATIVDNEVLVIRALDPDDEREIRCRVAGPTALLIAKAHKIQDRLEQRGRPDRLIDKDAGDVYRLMQTTPVARVREVTARLLANERVAQPSRRGVELLHEQFGARRAPGVEMAVRSLRGGGPRRSDSRRLRRFRVRPAVARRRSVAGRLAGVSFVSNLSAICPRTGPNRRVRQITRHHQDRPEGYSDQH